MASKPPLQAAPQPVLFEPSTLPAASAVAAPGPAGSPRALVAALGEASAAATSGAAAALLVTEAQVAAFISDSSGGGGGVGAEALGEWDELTRGALRFAVRSHAFTGKQGQHLPPVPLPGAGGGVEQLLLVGLGKGPLAATKWGESPFHAAGGALAAAAKAHGIASLFAALPALPALLPLATPAGGSAAAVLPAAAAAAAGEEAALERAAVAALVLGAVGGLYEGNVRYKSKPEPKARLESLTVVVPAAAADDGAGGGGAAAALQAAAAKGAALARARLTARYLVEAPANVCTPSHLAAAAAHVAAAAPGRFSLKVLEEGECLDLGMRLFVGVARGSDEPPKLVHLAYKPPAAAPSAPPPRKIALVGKGLTFDSGGYNLKVQGGIEMMKLDMGGAGAILGAARALADLQPQGVEVHFITAACENMVSGRATRPGDIHLSAAGKTVEVNDTDAEGRLTLADALWYAQAMAGAETVVDIATLTGAAGVALGQGTGALFSNGDALAASLDAAARATGEKLWRMPLDEGLKPKLDSPVADMKNYAGRWGGAITAALFLQEFIQEGTSWAHLDIAGPAWDEAAGLPTGFGAAALAEWLAAGAP